MKHIQSGKGLVQVLVLIGVLVVLGIFLIPQLTKNNSMYSNGTNSANPTAMPAQAAPQGDVALMLDPAAVNTTAGQTFSVAVNMDTKSDTVSASDIHLMFDPIYLTATSVKAGTPLPLVLTPGAVESGKASITVGASSPTTPYKGTGTLAVVTFTAKKTGTTMISFDTATAVAAVGKKGTVLGSTTGSSVTIK